MWKDFQNWRCPTDKVRAILGGNLCFWSLLLLHYAARFSSPELVKLFLHNVAQTEVPFARKVWWDKGMLPLNSALYAAREAVTVYQRKSLFKWIVSLFLPSLKQSLAVNKLLVESSNNIEQFAYHYAMEGKLVELAVLLIFAREKVFNGRMMIPQCIRNQILSLIDEEVKLMRECKQRELTQIHQKMMGMSSTVLLLEVFERAGHTIGEYLQSQQPDDFDAIRAKQAEEVENSSYQVGANYEDSSSSKQHYPKGSLLHSH